jgi:hypothetical protein
MSSMIWNNTHHDMKLGPIQRSVDLVISYAHTAKGQYAATQPLMGNFTGKEGPHPAMLDWNLIG